MPPSPPKFWRSGDLSLATRLDLARKAFALTARYDGSIATELERLSASTGDRAEPAPAAARAVALCAARQRRCATAKIRTRKRRFIFPRDGSAGPRRRRASCRARNFPTTILWTWTRPGAGAGISPPAAVIVKHNNPCGTAEQETLAEAYVKALACDPVSAFGGVMAFNRPLDGETAEEVAKLFAECVVAPGYDPAALEKFAAKKNLRLMDIPAWENVGARIRSRVEAHFRRRAGAGAGSPRLAESRTESCHAARAHARGNRATCSSGGKSAST